MPTSYTLPGSHLERIRSYYQEFNEISEAGYIKLETVALIMDMLYLFGLPSYADLVYIFGNTDQADTIAAIHEIIKPGRCH